MQNAIEFKNLVKRFGDRTVLKGLSLAVGEGSIHFVLGTSGTGKSVLLKNLVGLLQSDEGEIWIEGREVSKFSEAQFLEVRKFCGMVFQQPALFDSLSVFENVAFGLRRLTDLSEIEIQMRVGESLHNVYLAGVEKQFPAELSYGMQKRVSIARTLALRPRILLFDEPTTGLDPVTTTAINTLIQELSIKLKTTSIVVSHDINCALSIAHHVVVLDQGRIVDQGSPKDLMSSTVPLVQGFMSEVAPSAR